MPTLQGWEAVTVFEKEASVLPSFSAIRLITGYVLLGPYFAVRYHNKSFPLAVALALLSLGVLLHGLRFLKA